MRFFSFCATALAAVALAAPQEGYAESTTTSLTRATMTRTVLRVVETVTATHNGSVSAYETTTTETTLIPTAYASATGHLPSYGNGTTSVLGTGARPSGSRTSSASFPVSTGAAGKFGVEAMGIAAVAGLVGLAIF